MPLTRPVAPADHLATLTFTETYVEILLGLDSAVPSRIIPPA